MFVQCVRIMYIAEFFVSCLIDYDHILVNAVISGGYLRVGTIPPFYVDEAKLDFYISGTILVNFLVPYARFDVAFRPPIIFQPMDIFATRCHCFTSFALPPPTDYSFDKIFLSQMILE